MTDVSSADASTGHGNKELVREMLHALERGDPETFFGSYDDDLRHTVIGTTKFSGVFQGKAALTGWLQSIVAEVDPESNVEYQVDNLIAEGEWVFVQARGKGARTKTGNDYNNTYCLVFRIVDGKVKESWEYLDTELVTSAFS